MCKIEEIKDYINGSFFVNRRHAYGIRAILMEMYPEEKGFNFKWANTANSTNERVVTFDEAHDYIFFKTKRNDK